MADEGLEHPLLLYRVSRPHVAVLGEIPGSGNQWADVAQHPEDQTVPEVTVLRVEVGIFFANAEHVRAVIEDAATADGTQAVVLDCQTVPSVDVTGARMLHQLAAACQRPRRLVLPGRPGPHVAALSDQDGPPEYHRTGPRAVHFAQVGPTRAAAREG